MKERDMKIEEYFCSGYTGGDPKQKVLWAQIGNQLVRGGILTMCQLCEASVKQIREVRNIGEKSLAIILEEREKYIKESR